MRSAGSFPPMGPRTHSDLQFVVFYVDATAAAVREIVTRFPAFPTETDYQELLAILFRSVDLFHPGARATVLTDERTRFGSLPPNVAVARFGVDPDRIVYSRLSAQIEHLTRQADS